MKDSLRKYVGNIDFIDLKVIDIIGRVRHVILPGDRLTDELFEEGVGFDASNFGYSSIENSDMIMLPDPDTAFEDPFFERKTLSFFCDVLRTEDRKPFEHYPRNVLRATLEKLKSIGAADAMLGPELEFHIFEGMSYRVSENQAYFKVDVAEGFWNSGEFSNANVVERKMGYHRCPPADAMANFRNEAVMIMNSIGIPVKYHHHEVSSAQHEIEFRFQNALNSADSIILARYILQNLASRYNLKVTFMPKPLFEEAGNGMHIHQYLVDGTGKNLFACDIYCGLGEMALQYTSGILKHSLTGALLAFTNPSTNSYRRLVPGFEAPICAVFAKGNRSAAVRIPGYVKDKHKARIEFRTIDASCNPYYGIAAMLLAGVDGVKQKLDHKELGFGPIETNIYNMNDEYRNKIRFFPSSLEESLRGLKEDNEFLKPGFPDELIRQWILVKEEEARYVNSVPSPAEYQLYFDL